MSWLRRLLLLAGLVTGAWLLGGTGHANADVRVEIDRLEVGLEIPLVDVGLQVGTGLAPPQPEAPVPPKPAPRVENPAPPEELPPPARPAVKPPVQAPVQAEAPQQQQPAPQQQHHAQPTNPAHVPEQPQAEQPTPGTLPQSGAGTSTGTQIPVGTLPHATRPPTTTTALVSTEQHDVPRSVRAEEPTFSPD